MKVTSVKQQVRNAERVSVFIDGKYSFSLSLDELLKYRLKSGDELAAVAVKKFKRISQEGKFRNRTLEWLLNRPHSERELRDYLYRKKIESEQIDFLIREFTSKGYLDNAKFAAWYTELAARRGKSDRAIRSELFKKGISREMIEEVVGKNETNEAERLETTLAKKTKLARYKNDPEKLARYLVSQGFSWQDVKERLGKF